MEVRYLPIKFDLETCSSLCSKNELWMHMDDLFLHMYKLTIGN